MGPSSRVFGPQVFTVGDQVIPRWKKPTKDEIFANRREIAERARTGDLRLPDALVQIRKGLGMTQAEFAGMLFLQKRQIAEIEAGKANPTLVTLQKIGRIFGFEVGFVPRNPDLPK